MSSQSNAPQQQPDASIDSSAIVSLVTVKSTALPEVSAPIISTVAGREGGTGDYLRTVLTKECLGYSDTWTKSMPLKKLFFPKDVLPGNIHLNRLMQSWCFWRADVKLSIHINATKFHSGQLFVGYLYDPPSVDEKYRIDRTVITQMPGTFVNASVNNVVTLDIPYQAIVPYSPITNNWFKVYILEFAPLRATENVATSVDFSIYFSLSNFEFGGMRAEPQMLSLMRYLVKGAEGALKEFGRDLNRDKPVDSSAPIVTLQRSSQSWCAGENYVENLNVLRLDAAVQQSHRSRSDDMQVSVLVSRFGLSDEFIWNMSDVRGKILQSIRVTPFEYYDNFKVVASGEVPLGWAPATGVLSSMFTYWRGSLEFRFDFIATAYHSGKIGIRFVPGHHSVIKDWKKIIHSYGEDFTLDGVTSCRYEVPFICHKPWLRISNPSRTEIEDYSGILYLVVLNQLTRIEGVASDVPCKIYVRGGRDFELSVPNVPMLSLPYERALIKSKFFKALNVSKVWAIIKDDSTFWLARNDSPEGIGDFSFQIEYPRDDDYDQYASIDTNYPDSWPTFSVIKNGVVVASDRPKTIQWTRGGDDADGAHRWQAQLKGGEFDKFDLAKWKPIEAGWSWGAEQVFSVMTKTKPQAGEEIAEVSACQNLNTPRIDVHNENFMDLKTLCRRYNFYSEGTVVLNKGFAIDRTILQIPIYPDGLELDVRSGSTVASSANLCRHAPIALLANAYRFFRGGLRFKIVVRVMELGGVKARPLTLCYTHVPDVTPKNRMITTYKEGQRQFFPSGYAMYVQNIDVNEVVELEIPYYAATEYLYLGRTTNNRRYENSMGMLAISSKSPVEVDMQLTLSIYWALADDARFYYYQGFSQLCLNPFAKMDMFALEESEFDIVKTEDFEHAAPESILFSDSDVEKIGDRLDTSVEKVMDRLKELATPFLTTVTEQVKNRFDLWFSSFAGQLGQVMLNPCIKSVALAVATMIYQLLQLFGVAGTCVNMAASALSKVYSNVVSYIFPNESTSEAGVNTDVDLNAEWLSRHYARAGAESGDILDPAVVGATLISSLLTLLGIGSSFRTHGGAWVMSHLRKDIHGFAMASNSLVTFFSNNLSLFRYLGKYFRGLVNPEISLAGMYLESKGEIEKWIGTVDRCCEPLFFEKARLDPKIQQKIFELNLIGDALSSKYFTAGRNDAGFSIIMNRCVKIRQAMNSVISDAAMPGVKYEPFVIHLVGAPGIGKSFLTEKIATLLLKSIGYTSFENPVYVKTAGTKHWNALKAQPVLQIDDFFFSSADAGREQTEQLFCLKSPAVFNPEQAELKDKKRFYSPKIVILCGNVPFPHPAAIECPDALWRRRDVLVSARLKNDKREIKQFEASTLKAYDHLEFSEHPSVRDNRMFPDFVNSGTGSYVSSGDWFALLEEKFKAYNAKELQNVKDRMDRLTELFPPGEAALGMSNEECDALFDNLAAHLMKTNVTDFLKTVRDTVDGTAELRADVAVAAPEAGDESRPLLDDVALEVDGYDLDDEAEEPIVLDDVRYAVPITRPLKYKINGQEALLMNYIENDRTPYTFERKTNDDCMHPSDASGYIWMQQKRCFQSPLGHDLHERRCGNACRWQRPAIRKRFYASWIAQNVLLWQDRDIPSHMLPRGILCNDWMIQEALNGHHMHITRTPEGGPLPGRVTLPELDCSIVAWYKEKIKLIPWWSIVEIATKVAKWLSVIAIGAGLFFLARGALRGNAAGPVDPATSTTSTTPLYPPLQRFEEFDTVHGQGSTYSPTDRPKISGGIRSRVSALEKVREQFARSDPEAVIEESPFVQLLRRNFGALRVPQEDGKVLVVRCLGICGSYVLTVAHAFRKFVQRPDADGEFGISVGGNSFVNVRFERERLYTFRNSQLCVYTLPSHIPAFRDLRKHIASAAQHQTIGLQAVVGYIGFDSKNDPFANFHEIQVRSIHGLVVDYVDSGGQAASETVSKPIYQYAGFTAPGLCGSVLFSWEPFRIFGMHCAGTGRLGYSEPVIDRMFAGLSVSPQCELKPYSCRKPPVDGILYLGEIEATIAPRLPTTSKIIPSLVYGELYPPVKFPAPLVQNDPERGIMLPEHPLISGIAKHGGAPRAFPPTLVREAARDLGERLRAVCPPLLPNQPEVLTNELVFGGIPGVKGYRALQLGTSEGFPLVLERDVGHHDKRWLFDYHDESTGRVLDSIRPELQRTMDLYEEMRARGVVPPTVFQDCLKDARIDKSKLHTPGKTRVFSVSPVEFTFAIKRYYGHFQAAYSASRPKSETAIGINPNGPEWTNLYRVLCVLGEDGIVTGDYAAFGDKLQSECIEAAFDIMDDWYERYFSVTERNRCIRKTLRRELLHVPHLARTTLYKMFAGIPSGFALTVEVNSLVNCLYMRICWQILMQGTKYDSLDRFRQLTRLVTYGDDLIMSVHPDVRPLFNFNSIQTVLAMYDIEFTSGRKEAKSTDFESIWEAKFLKRNFKEHPMRDEIMAPLSEDSVKDCVNWIHKGGDSYTATIENVRAALESAYSLGWEKHSEFRNKVIRRWSDLFPGEEFRCMTWHELDNRIWGHEGFWLKGELLLTENEDCKEQFHSSG